MAGSPAGSKPEKTMSSRLLTMKFMQRAAATAASKEAPQSPSAADSTTSTPKRQRMTPTNSPGATPSSDMEAIAAALKAEEDKRREAVARQAAEAGETEWVLDYGAGAPAAQPMVVTADSLDADDDDVLLGGRQAYGNFKRKKKTETKQQTNEESDEDDDDDDEDNDDDIESMINKAKAKASSKKQQPGKVKLSQLTSISGGRHGTVGGGGGKSQKKRKHK